MPKIDPISGCSVMTLPEYWMAEARRSGRSAAEEMAVFYDDLYDALDEQQNNLRSVSGAQEFFSSLYEAEESQPTKILEVLEVQCRMAPRSSFTRAAPS